MSDGHVVVVGGGISGLTAALDLVAAGARVTVVEARPAPGGLLRRVPLPALGLAGRSGPGGRAGLDGLDVGVEAFLARRPEGVALVERLGLADRLVSPTAAAPAVWRTDGVRPLPRGTVLGVPGRRTDLSTVLRADELRATEAALARRAARGTDAGAGGRADVDVATAVTAEVGRPVLDVLVEPLLGGVHAGRTDELSLRSVVPSLWPAWHEGRPLADAVDALGERATPGAPVFTGLQGGMAQVVDAAVRLLREAGAEVRTGVAARGLRRAGGRWHVDLGPTGHPRTGPGSPDAGTSGVPGRAVPAALEADAVVVALPTRPAEKLLRDVLPEAADVLARTPVVGVGVVALAVQGAVPERSGLLVPPADAAAAGLHAKAVTFSSRKWAWLADLLPDDTHVVRVSFGRRGDEGVLQRPDEALVRLAHDDLATVLAVDGLPAPRLLGGAVARWGGALPQHTVGHVARVERLRALVAGEPGLAVAGGWLDGVGVPACIAAGRRAAAELVGPAGILGP